METLAGSDAAGYMMTEIEKLELEVEVLRLILKSALGANRHTGEMKKKCAIVEDSTAKCDCGKDLLDKLISLALKDSQSALTFIMSDEITEHLNRSKK